MRFCVNHGEPNPDRAYPDWFCGAYFEYHDIPEHKRREMADLDEK